MKKKLTISVDESVTQDAKDFAAKNGMSLSGMVEHVLRKGVHSKEHFMNWPVADWILELSAGPVIYSKPLTKSKMKKAWAASHAPATKNRKKAA